MDDAQRLRDVVEEPAVDTQRARRSRAQHGDTGEQEEAEGELLLPQRRLHAPLAGSDHDCRHGEHDRQHCELDSGQRCQPGDDDEADLGAACRLGEGARPGVHGGEDERIGEGLRRDEGRVHQVGHEHGERGERGRHTPAQSKPEGEQEHRDRRQ